MSVARSHTDLELDTIAQLAKDETDYIEDSYNHTDAGDAEFFAACNDGWLKYDHTRGKWMLFDGHHWLPRKEGEIYRLEKDAMRARQHHAELALPGLDATDREQDPDAAEEEKLKSKTSSGQRRESPRPAWNTGLPWRRRRR